MKKHTLPKKGKNTGLGQKNDISANAKNAMMRKICMCIPKQK